MKKLNLIGVLLVLATVAFAQTPQGMNYQAVARNAAGNILANQAVGIRITITDGNAGPTLYQETHSDTTNQFGLFTLSVGNGTPVVGTFSSISWSTITPWLEVAMDPTGGSSYVVMGSSQLLSVPYALYAAQSASAPGDDWGTQTVHSTSELNGNGTSGNPIGIAQQGATNGKVLKWNGTQWSPAIDSNNTYTQGTGISIAGNVITNTGDVNAADDITNITNANGDLTGTYPNPGVAKIRGTTVSTTAPTSGQVLKYNGAQWTPSTDNNTTYTQGTGINITGTTINNTITSLGNLSDVNTTGASSGLVLKYNGSQWIPGTDNTGSSSGAVNVTPRLSGDGTAGNPLDIAQQGASTGQVLQWNGTSWIPASGAGSYWNANGNDISNSNSGNVGIGTAAPQSKLDVAGNISLNDNSLLLRSGNNADHGLRYDGAVDGPYLFGYNGGALGTSGLPNSLEWSFNGDVSSKNNFYTQHNIVVDNAATNNGSLSNGLNFGNGGEGIASNRTTATNQYGLDFYTGNANRMSITNSGNVGIGTTSPSYPLQFSNSAGDKVVLKYTGNPNNVTGLGTLGNKLVISGGDYFDASNGIVLGYGSSSNGIATVMSVTPSPGRVGINQTTPAATLDVNGTFKLVDGTQGDKKVLTSNASGNASWQPPPGGQVCFQAFMWNHIQTIVSTVQTIIFDSTGINMGNAYNATTGVFTAPSDGIYYFYGEIFWNGTQPAGNNWIEFWMRKPLDSSGDKQARENTKREINYETTAVSGTYYLTAGEQVDFCAWNSQGSSNPINVGYGRRFNYVYGYKIY